MPALRPVPAVARVTCRGTSQGQAIVNVFHVKWSGGNWSLAAITYLANLIQVAYSNRFRTLLNANWSGDSVRAVDLSLVAGQEASVPLTGNGSIAGTLVPQQAACCVSWRIMRHYRGGHPRTYLGPLGGNAIESPTSLAATFIASVQAAASGFLADVNAGATSGETMRLVAVHRQMGGAELLIPETSDITSATVDSRIDTMRRRLGPDR